MSKPKLSICCISYKQEAYIAQTIEGFLMQRTSFPVEIIIADDCSPDNTTHIIRDYAARYPDRIRPLLREKNMGIMPNLTDAMQQCRGEYVAICEGDDYWTDPDKLQIQVDLLDSRPDASFCFHRAEIRYDGSDRPSEISNQEPLPAEIDTKYLFEKGWFVMTASIVYRRAMLEIPDWYPTLTFGDYPLQLLLSLKGPALFIDRVMSVYRKHGGGTTAGFDTEAGLRKVMAMMEHLNRTAGGRLGPLIEVARRRGHDELVEEIVHTMLPLRFGTATYRKNYRKLLRYALPGSPKHRKYLVRFLLFKLGY